MLPLDIYETVTRNIPIICVDIIPVRKRGNGWQIGIITRATGSETGKPALIGGRIRRDELIDSAIGRHLSEDCSVNSYEFALGNIVSRPFYVQQYLNQASSVPPLGYDPTKHAIALTYLVTLLTKPRPKNEAIAYYWIDEADVPEKAGFNQHLVMLQAFEFLRGTRA